MDKPIPTPKSILREIKILHLVLFMSLILFTFIMVYILQTSGGLHEFDKQMEFIIKTLVIFTVVLIIPLSFILPQRIISRIKANLPLIPKLLQYRTALIIRFATLNFAGSLVAISFFIIADTNLMFLQAIVLLVFFIFKPSAFKIAQDLNLGPDEKRHLMPEEE